MNKSEKSAINEYAEKFKFSFEISDQPNSIVGWNWGDAKVEGSTLAYQIQDKGNGEFFTGFEVPLSLIQKAEKDQSGRNVTLYLATDTTDLDSRVQQLEVRCPPLFLLSFLLWCSGSRGGGGVCVCVCVRARACACACAGRVLSRALWCTLFLLPDLPVSWCRSRCTHSMHR